MSEYRIDLKVRNNLLLKAIEDAGYKNTAHFCKTYGLQQTLLGELLNLKVAPLRKDGTFRQIATELMDIFGALPEDLWTHEQLTMELETNKGKLDVDKAEMVRLMDRTATGVLEHLTPEESMETKIIQDKVNKILDGLAPQPKKVLRLLYGVEINDDKKTLEQVGAMFDVSRERIRQIKVKGERTIRRHIMQLDPQLGKELSDIVTTTSACNDDTEKRIRLIKEGKHPDHVEPPEIKNEMPGV